MSVFLYTYIYGKPIGMLPILQVQNKKLSDDLSLSRFPRPFKVIKHGHYV